MLDYNDFIELLKNRRSVRIYNEKKIKNDDIKKIIESGIHAPSPTNSQGWKFKIIDDKKHIISLADIIEKKLKNIFNKIEDGSMKEHFIEYGKNFTFIKKAPCVILLYSHKPRTITKNLFRNKINLYKGEGTLLSLGMAMQNMMLAAELAGISSCALTGPLAAEKEITGIYPPPPKYELSGLLTLGFTDKKPANPGRKNIDKFII